MGKTMINTIYRSLSIDAKKSNMDYLTLLIIRKLQILVYSWMIWIKIENHKL